jgi:6-phosphogluconolactonase (cycloisomerase 2 family)
MTALNRVRAATAAAEGPVPRAAARRPVRRRAGALGTAALGAAALSAALVAALATPALAANVHSVRGHFGFGAWGDRAVFVQTDNTAGNEVIAYDRGPSGTLTQVGAYQTGGLGGQLVGSVVDHLASQGSLALDKPAGLLIAVNAGSNTISVFGVRGDSLRLQQVLSSGGTFPVSVAINGNVAYVLNAENGGAVQGFWIGFGGLEPLPGSNRALGLNAAATPQFTNTPGQVAFTPDGRQLIVTTKANGNDIDVFSVNPDGSLSAAPVVNSEPGTVPFAIAFDPAGDVAIAEAGPNSVATFALSPSGTLTQLAVAATSQSATCWITAVRGLLFADNAGSSSVSAFASGPGGSLTAVGGPVGTDAGTVDSAASPGGRFLYVQTGGAGIVDEFAVSPAGALTEIGSVTVPGAVGGEGIVVG